METLESPRHPSPHAERSILQLHDVAIFHKSKCKFARAAAHTKPSVLGVATTTIPQLKLETSFLKPATPPPPKACSSSSHHKPVGDAAAPLSPASLSAREHDHAAYVHKFHPRTLPSESHAGASFVGATLPTVHRSHFDNTTTTTPSDKTTKVLTTGGFGRRRAAASSTHSNVSHIKLADEPPPPSLAVMKNLTKPSVLNVPRTRRRGDDPFHFSSIVQGSRPPSRTTPVVAVVSPQPPAAVARGGGSRGGARADATNQDDLSHGLHRKSSMSDLEIVNLADMSSKVVFRTKFDGGGAWRDHEADTADFQAYFGSWDDGERGERDE
ncbi:Aste57867_9835 [Aphanomyces stellatus]|uniref:Aste57867_9835 protein n=1 Tax=Aphanomyces stellatus TaxID=120398 RepID=A0A485KNV0_9STRA|nr:hypothetical protein As57867_009796 [Aphanomyces stellatus]VFT86714.1 Aste57867_9835 [Aphanomyces stellatus]